MVKSAKEIVGFSYVICFATKHQRLRSNSRIRVGGTFESATPAVAMFWLFEKGLFPEGKVLLKISQK